MSWGCCTPGGQCQQGPGCPAGASDKDACQSASVARTGKRRPALHSVEQVKTERQTQRKGLGRVLINWIEAVLLLVAIGLLVHAIDPIAQSTSGEGVGQPSEVAR